MNTAKEINHTVSINAKLFLLVNLQNLHTNSLNNTAPCFLVRKTKQEERLQTNRIEKSWRKGSFDLCCAEYRVTEETISRTQLEFPVSITESQFGVTASLIVLAEKKHTIWYQREKMNQQRIEEDEPFTQCFCSVVFCLWIWAQTI